MNSTSPCRRADVDSDWRDLADQWSFRPGTVYLNHGSFGPAPKPVRDTQLHWQRQLYEQPMDFFVRQLPLVWADSRQQLATFVGADDEDIIFVENATAAMNLVAQAVQLQPGDEVVLTDHEYGAVRRIWQRRAAQCHATVREVSLPVPFRDRTATADAFVEAVAPPTRVVVLSHVTSPTAVVLPVAEILNRLRKRDIVTVIDGPHALAQVPVNVQQLGCDFYTASCHKWLSAPFGSGMLYVSKRWQSHVRPLFLSWGLLPPDEPERWWQEFYWLGTRDPSAYLAVPSAIAFLEQVGWAAFRQRTHYLANYARNRLLDQFHVEPLVPDSPAWYGSMAHVPIPACNPREIQDRLWQEFGIEVPFVSWKNHTYIRVSCHLYTMTSHLDYLADALRKIFARMGETHC